VGTTSLLFKRGPQNFLPRWNSVASRNIASSGAAVETVVERNEILIAFDMPALWVADDLANWGSLMQWMIGGGQVKFYPNSGLTDWYTCKDEAGTWEPKRLAAGVYGYSFLWRVLNDAQAPVDPGVILRRFMGVSV
jgi:hypothetical protein